MNYAKIIYYDTANANGLSTVLFVQGCTNNCYHCHNPETHDFNAGKPFLDKQVDDILNSFKNGHIKNFVISGGDPCHDKNIKDIINLCKIVKARYPIVNIIVYTGYTIEQLESRNSSHVPELFQYIDCLIDGKYIEEQATRQIDYRGSTNQRCWFFYTNIYERRVITDISDLYFKEKKQNNLE